MKRAWSDEERRAVFEGIQIYGKRWSSILSDPRFSSILKNRTRTALTMFYRWNRKDIVEATVACSSSTPSSVSVTPRKSNRKSRHVILPKPSSYYYRPCRHLCGCQTARTKHQEEPFTFINRHGLRTHEKCIKFHPNCDPSQQCFPLFSNLSINRKEKLNQIHVLEQSTSLSFPFPIPLSLSPEKDSCVVPLSPLPLLAHTLEYQDNNNNSIHIVPLSLSPPKAAKEIIVKNHMVIHPSNTDHEMLWMLSQSASMRKRVIVRT